MADSRDRLRIVLVSPFPPPYGGMAVQASLLHRRLMAEGVKVYCIDYTEPLPAPWRKLQKVWGLRTVVKWLRFVRKVRRLAQSNCVFHVLASSYGSFFLWAAPCLLICHWRKVPIIMNYRGGAAEAFLRKYHRLVVPLFKKADRIVVPSGFLFFIFIKYGLYSEVIPNILDLENLETNGNAEGELQPPRIVINRNFEPIYNLRMAILAFAIIQARFPEAQLRLIGEGAQRQELEKLVTELGIHNVEFLGRRKNEEVLQILLDSDLMLNPTNVDNMPISLLEAMALGLPIVTTNAGGIPHILEDRKSALLVPIGDHLAMANAAIELLENTRLRQHIRDNAKKQAAQYSWRKIWPLWRELYLKAMDETQHLHKLQRTTT